MMMVPQPFLCNSFAKHPYTPGLLCSLLTCPNPKVGPQRPCTAACAYCSARERKGVWMVPLMQELEHGASGCSNGAVAAPPAPVATPPPPAHVARCLGGGLCMGGCGVWVGVESFGSHSIWCCSTQKAVQSIRVRVSVTHSSSRVQAEGQRLAPKRRHVLLMSLNSPHQALQDKNATSFP